jgi:translation initiation factor eIF-2B subunit alpha
MTSTATTASSTSAAAAYVEPDHNIINNNNNIDDEHEFKSLVLNDLRNYLNSNTGELFDMSVNSTPVCAIKALLGVVQRSTATTMMHLQDELRQARTIMIEEYTIQQQSRSNRGGGLIALTSGCDLYMKYVTRTFLEFPDFETSRVQILQRGQRFAGMSMLARDRIAHIANDFIQEGQTVLTHGWSRVVASILLKAAETKHFDIIFLEGRPDAAGIRAAKSYANHQSQIPTTVVLDAAVGHVMERVDVVLVGAEAVVENGGFVNKMGTYALAACAKAHGKPFYVAAESLKFSRLYPLNQRDLPDMGNSAVSFVDTTTRATKKASTSSSSSVNDDDDEDIGSGRAAGAGELQSIELPDSVTVDNPPCDFTPASFITLLFTDLGVLTPSAVSDELIRLYQ